MHAHPPLRSSPNRTPLRRALAALTAAGLGTAYAGTASAQTMDELSQGSSTGAQWTVGGAVASLPRYEGSDEYRARALPLVNYRNGRFFAGALGGIGYNFSPSSAFSFGPLLSYRIGRDEDASSRLRGLGDIQGGLDVGGFARWNLRPFFLHATLKQGLSGDAKGTSARFGAGYVHTVTPRDRVILDASIDWADKDIMQGYFGVTPGQSARSGLATSTADSGIRRMGVSAVWTHAFNAQWFSTVGMSAWRLGDEAARSPITVDRNAGSVSAGIGYRF